MQARTKELDDHWEGEWFCETCQDYTGQLDNHINHLVVGLPHICPRHQIHWGVSAGIHYQVNLGPNGPTLKRIQ